MELPKSPKLSPSEAPDSSRRPERTHVSNFHDFNHEHGFAGTRIMPPPMMLSSYDPNWGEYRSSTLTLDPDRITVPYSLQAHRTSDRLCSDGGPILRAHWATHAHTSPNTSSVPRKPLIQVGFSPLLSEDCQDYIPRETVVLAFRAFTDHRNSEGQPELSAAERQGLEDMLQPGTKHGQLDQQIWSGLSSKEQDVYYHLTEETGVDARNSTVDSESRDRRDDLALLLYGFRQRDLETGVESGQYNLSILPSHVVSMAGVDCGAYGNHNDFEPPPIPSSIDAISTVMDKYYQTSESEEESPVVALSALKGQEDVFDPISSDKDSAYCSGSGGSVISSPDCFSPATPADLSEWPREHKICRGWEVAGVLGAGKQFTDEEVDLPSELNF